MPDLVYRTKIVLDDSSVSSVKQELQDLEKMKRESTSTAPSGGTGGTSQQTSQLKRYTDEIRRNNSEVKKARSVFRELQRVKGMDAQATLHAAQKLEYLSSEVRENNQSLANQARALNLSEREQVQLNNAVTAGRNAMITADKSLENYTINLGMMGHQAGRNNKVFAGANQALFSFSDLVQDSAQFSQGFAQGMRAIGNNVGFTAELLINMNRHAKAANKTFFQALKGSFTGAAGALVVLNVAVTAATVLLDKFGGKSKEAKDRLNDLTVEVKTSQSFFKSFIGEQVDGYTELTTNIDTQREALRGALDLLNEQEDSVQRQIDALQIVNQNIVGQTEAAKEARRVNAGKLAELLQEQEVNGEIFELTKGIINNKLAELRAQELINKALEQSGVAYRTLDVETYEVTRNVVSNLQTLFQEASAESEAYFAEIEKRRKEQADANLASLRELLSNQDANIDVGYEQGTFGAVKQEISMLEKSLLRLPIGATEAIESIKDRIAFLKKSIGDATEMTNSNLEWTRQNAINLASSLSFIARGLFQDNKSIAIANALINTYEAATRALSATPVPAINAVLAGGVVASGLAQVRKIQQTEIGSTPSGSASGISAPNQGVTITTTERQPMFVPTSERQSQKPMFIIENRIDRKGIATMVRDGERQIRATQTANS